MRLLAIDFGTKKCGIAISDPLKIISQPLKTIFYSDLKNLITEINIIVNEYKPIEKIILGFPKNVDGSITPTGKKILLFKKQLELNLDIEIILWDEKYTTKSSLKIMTEMDISNTKKKEIKDSIAAQKILEDFMDKTN